METKYIIIPFDVQRAKRISNGEEEGKIVTRDGKEVRIVCFNVRHNNYPIVGLIDEGDYESAESFSKNGEYSIGDGELDCDLLLSVPEWTTFKDGDIVGFGDSLVGIFKSIDTARNTFSSYATIFGEELIFYETGWTLRNAHKANEKEVERIKSSLKTSEDPKAKEYFRRFFGIEEKKECKLKTFDKVLGRHAYGNWCADIFSRMDEKGNYVCLVNVWSICLPYNDQTAHLLGTSNDPE